MKKKLISGYRAPLMFYFFGKHLRIMSSKNSIFVDEVMIRINFVVDKLRKYADSRKFWRHSIIWFI